MLQMAMADGTFWLPAGTEDHEGSGGGGRRRGATERVEGLRAQSEQGAF